MHIVIGSTNPVKFAASRVVLTEIYPTAAFTTVDVPSGVPVQPWGDAETRSGAHQRASNALRLTGADMAVGLEGGVVETEFGLFTCAWCVIIDNMGHVGVGGSACIQLPASVADQLRQGIELGPAMDALSGQTNIKHKEGAIGVLTNNLLTRQGAYEVIIRMALAPFLHPVWYERQPNQ